MSEPISSAIKFNTLKHHSGYIAESFARWRSSDLNTVLYELNGLGANQSDIYTGHLTVGKIINEVAGIIDSFNIIYGSALKRWLGSRDYREVFLSDHSKWIIRLGEDPEKYIHIHPARNQECVTRFKANHLKVAIYITIFNQFPQIENSRETNTIINRIRKEIFGLSPVRSVSESWKIINTLNFLQNTLSQKLIFEPA